MRRFFRDRLPSRDSISNHRWLQPVQHWLRNPNLWHLHRRSVAGGVAIGLFCGLIPGPLQMISAALLAILLRVNLPVAAFTTLYTNPFTIVPLYVLAYEIGILIIGSPESAAMPAFPEMHWHDAFIQVWAWVMSLGKPLLIGLPILALGLSIIGYISVRLAWRLFVLWKWHSRNRE
jgi:uncharacterized protein (DUF2062 family)